MILTISYYFIQIPTSERNKGVLVKKIMIFFVLSHDSGVDPNIIVNGTWESGFVLEITKSPNNEYTAKVIKVPIVDKVEIQMDYDINNIPEEVLDYLLISSK